MKKLKEDKIEVMNTFRLYAKFKGEKRFQPLDWKSGRPVINLIYASVFTEKEAKEVLKEAERCNPEVSFELRLAEKRGADVDLDTQRLADAYKIEEKTP